MAKVETKKTVCVGCGGPKCRATGCNGGKLQDPKAPGSQATCGHCKGTGMCPSWLGAA